jgi:hypothetical protein
MPVGCSDETEILHRLAIPLRGGWLVGWLVGLFSRAHKTNGWGGGGVNSREGFEEQKSSKEVHLPGKAARSNAHAPLLNKRKNKSAFKMQNPVYIHAYYCTLEWADFYLYAI